MAAHIDFSREELVHLQGLLRSETVKVPVSWCRQLGYLADEVDRALAQEVPVSLPLDVTERLWDLLQGEVVIPLRLAIVWGSIAGKVRDVLETLRKTEEVTSDAG